MPAFLFVSTLMIVAVALITGILTVQAPDNVATPVLLVVKPVNSNDLKKLSQQFAHVGSTMHVSNLQHQFIAGFESSNRKQTIAPGTAPTPLIVTVFAVGDIPPVGIGGV